MPQSTNLNKSPYFDDFDPLNNFYRVLFRPGYSIQSRELTTLQSILQNQIENLAKANFKQGSIVVPGEIIFDKQYNYVKVSSFTNNIAITDYIGVKMTGNTSGVVAKVVNATIATETNAATLFVKYENSGTSNTQATFTEGEIITSNSSGNPTAIVGASGNVKPTESPALGFGSAVTVKEGIYFINGTLVRNDTQTIILEKYSNTPSYKVGFLLSEKLVTPEEDFSLLDNAQGYSNFAAPGAHRLSFEVSLSKRDLDAPDQKDFVQLLLIQSGNLSSTVETVQTNNIIQDLLARRTFDESGDYVVRDFGLGLREHLNFGSNNGVYTSSQGGSDNKFIAAVDAGKAYVRGFEIETTSVRYVDIDKARDYATQSDTFVSPLEGSNFTVNNLYSFPDIEGKSQNITGTGLVSTNPYQEVKLYDTYVDALYGETTANLDSTAPEDERFFVLTLKTLSATTLVSSGTPYTHTGSGGSINGYVRYYKLNSSSNRAFVVVTNSTTFEYINGGTIAIAPSALSMGGITGYICTVERLSTPYVGLSKTKYLQFLSGNSTSKIYDKSSSQYKLGLFGTEYFSKILCKNAINFTKGKIITGQTSGATAIVELLLPETNEVILSKVSGIFQSGETVLSELDGTSTPYNFIEDDGSIAYLKPVTFGSGYTSVSGVTINVNGTDKTSVIGFSNITLTSTELRSIRITAAARLSLGKFDTSPTISVTGGTGASYIAVLNKSNVINYDSSSIKSFFNSTTGNPFTGDVTSRQDTYNVAGGATFSATENSYFITSDNLNSRPDLDLVNGDVIKVTDDSGTIRKYLVKFATKSGTSSTARIYVYGLVLSNFTAKTVERLRSKLNGISGNTLLLPLPNKNVKTTILDPNNTNISYTVQREFLGNLDGSGTVTISVGTNETFLSYSSNNWIFANPQNGNLLDLSGAVTLGNNAQSATINLGVSFAALAYKIIAPVVKADTAPKTKTLIENQEYQIASGFSYSTIPINYADGYKLKGVYMSASGADATANDVNIADRFIFDGGQRDTHYDLARLIRKPGAIVPTNKMLVVFDYFKHIGSSGTGDYFTVDSYTFTDNFKYKDIPDFNSSVYGTISLRDVVDFRPRVSDYTGLDTETVVPGYNQFTTINALKFTGTGSAVSTLPLYGTSYYTGYQYYLNRIDALYITKDGTFKVSKGTPSLNPQTPSELSDGILLYYFNIPAYTSSLKDIQIKSIDNKRYTMRDIGKLEKRIEKLEYYTVLSLLEQDTFNTQVRDSFGNERFKNGVLVDNFEGHNVGNTNSLDYSCAIDTQTGVVRPNYYASQTKLIEKNLNDSQRTANGYQKTGELFTLPFSEQLTVSNPYATKTIDINPGKSSKFSGILTLDPSIDEWKDTYKSPELIVNENSIFDTIKNNNANLWGSIWNEWQILWTGTPNYALNNSAGTTQFNSTVTSVIQGKTRTRTRNGTQNRLTPYGSSNSSVNQRVVSNAYTPYARTNVVKFIARGLEPLTRLYAFFDGIEVSSWVNPDDVIGITTPFTGIAGYAEKGFGTSIITDTNGNVSGIFLVPAGYSPTAGKKLYDREISASTFYNISSTQRNFTAGIKTFRLTSSSTNTSSNSQVKTFAETEYIISGAPNTNQSTRSSNISRRSASTTDTVQTIGGVRVNINQDGLLDPLAQTFTISGYQEGLFASSIDLYFSSKTNSSGADTDRPVSVYLTETSGGVPTRTIIPFSQTSLNPDTILRIKVGNDIATSITFNSGETITGKTSGATGTIKTNLTVSSANTRYNLILSNYDGTSFIAGEEIVINRSPAITTTKFYIDQDCGIVENVRVTNFGSGYSSGSTTITINGDNGGSFGSVATASAKIYSGKIYDITVTNNGSGYYTAPTVSIIGGDSLATAESVIRITNPAVKMGISTSSDATIKTTFKFPSPVYLESDKTYALIVSSSSPDYKLYSSKVGSPLLNSIIIASNQPGIGSIYKAQNSSSWIEDSLEDLKFAVNRCVFNTTSTATVELVNDQVEYVNLPNNPISIDSTLGISTLFGSNQRVVRINHPNHGMKVGDTVILADVTGIGSPSAIYGVPINLLNGIHSISNVGLDEYCIFIDSTLWNAANVSVTGSGSGGGDYVRATTNKLYQIIQSQIETLSFPSSSISHNIKTIYGKAVDSSTSNEYSLATSEEISPGDNYYFEDSRVIASKNNEVYRGLTSSSGKRSILYTLTMQSDVDNISPIIDANRTNIITVGSRVDNPTGNEGRYGTPSQTLTLPTSSAYTITNTTKTVKSVIISYSSSSGGNFVNTIDSNTRVTQSSTGASGQIVSVDLTNKKLKLIDVVGDFITGSTITQGSVTTTPTSLVVKSGVIIGWDSGTGSLKIKLTSSNAFEVNDIVNDNDAGTSPVTGRTVSAVSNTTGFLFVPDTNPYGSSAASKYVTKEVVLDTPGTSLDCKITANLFNNTDIKILYKIKPDGSTTDMNTISWEYFNGTGYSDNIGNIIPSNLKALSPSSEDLDSYIEYAYTATNLKPFKAFAIKIVFAGTNPALAPRLEDVRVIAHS
jgi:hypothetical protein